MKMITKIIAIVFIVIALLFALDLGFGYLGIFKTKTIGKAKENVKRELFEESQSYTERKKQEALKFYREYHRATDEQKEAIKNMVSHSFANFDENKLTDELKDFIKFCKYE